MIDLNTHGLDWRKRIRESAVFAALVTPAYLRSRFTQRQLAYAVQLQKPCYLLVQQGTTLPATVPSTARCYYWETTADLARLVVEIEGGER